VEEGRERIRPSDSELGGRRRGDPFPIQSCWWPWPTGCSRAVQTCRRSKLKSTPASGAPQLLNIVELRAPSPAAVKSPDVHPHPVVR